MTVYVDESIYTFRDQLYCHMIADTHEELVEMGHKIAMKPQWLQDAGTFREHFDLSPGMRQRAIRKGAQEIHRNEFIEIITRPERRLSYGGQT